MARVKITVLTPKIIQVFNQNFYRTNDSDECWIWQGTLNQRGYGRILIRSGGPQEEFMAHRVSYMIHNNLTTLHEEFVLHKCPGGGTPACVNPNHLYIGTKADNMRDKVIANRQTKGENVNTCVLTEAEVIQIRLDWSTGQYTQQQLSDKYGVITTAINKIINRKTWKHI